MRSKPRKHKTPARSGNATTLRIVGGRFGGQKLLYNGDPGTRPMKERIREAIFNLLGPAVRQKHAVDLFAGTGALGLEALSRGAAEATLIERHFPTAEVIRQNVAKLEVQEVTRIVTSNVFIWWKRKPSLGQQPWVVFCSPPYDFYVDRTEEVLGLLAGLSSAAPRQSMFVVEADSRFDFAQLPDPDAWDVRTYSPAVVGLWHKDD